MTRDDIMRMAREAGFQTGLRDYADGAGPYPVAQSVATGNLLPELERFAALVAAAEREACAQVCDLQAKKSDAAMLKAKRVKDRDIYSAAGQTAHWNAVSIRARGAA